MGVQKPNGITAKASPLGAGDPVEGDALSQMGATFAERKAAREKASDRGGKQVKADDVEDKAVSSSESKKRTRKS